MSKRTFSCFLAAALSVILAATNVVFGQDRQGRPDPQKTPPAADAGSQSSAAAVAQYRAARALHNGQQYDFAVKEWEAFLDKFADDPLAPKARHYAGVCYLQLKRYDDAISAYESLLKKKHANYELADAGYLNLGMAYYAAAQAGKAELHDKAAEAFAQLVQKFPDKPQVPQALFFRGEALYARDKKAEAVEAYKQLVEKHPAAPQRPDALYALGVTLQELNRNDQAQGAFDQFLKDYAQHGMVTDVRLRKADTLLAAKRYGEAEKLLATVAGVKDFKLADYAAMRHALALYEQKKYAEAANVYASVVTNFPNSEHASAATLSAGNCFYLAGMQDQARSWLGRAVEAGGERAAEAAHWLARSYLKDKQPMQALAVVEKVLGSAEKSEQLPLLRMDQADALYDLPDRRKESIAIYADVATRFPQAEMAPQAAYMAAFAGLNAGDFESANRHAEAFLKQHQNHSLRPDVLFVNAESLIQLGRPDDAGKLYQELLDKYPQHADHELWQVRRALALHLKKQHNEVVEYLWPLTRKFKQPALVAEAEFLLGSSLLERRNYKEAADAFNAALKAQPDWRQADETLLGLSLAQRGLNDLKSAKTTLQRLLAEFPKSGVLDRAHFRLGEFHYAAGEYKDAAEHHRWVIENTPKSQVVPNAMFGLAWAQLSQQNANEAEKTFTRLLDEHKDHTLAARAHHGRATARLQAKNFDGAIADANVYLQADSQGADRSDARYLVGVAQVGRNQYDEAIKTLESLLNDDPKFVGRDKVLSEIAWAYRTKKDDGAAATYFARIVDEHPQSPLAAESNYFVGEEQYAKGDYKGAAKAYEDAAAKAGKSDLGERARHKLAWAHFKQDDFTRAEREFSEQLRDYPQGELSADAAYMHAECLFKQNKFDVALPAYEKALAQSPSSEDFATLALLHAGQSAVQRKNWDAAAKYLERLQKTYEKSPYVAEATFELGQVAYRRAQELASQRGPDQAQPLFDEAIKRYENAADQAAGRPELYARSQFMVGQVLFDRRNHADAVRSFFKAAYGSDAQNASATLKTIQSDALFEAARCLEILKKLDQAKKLYAELVERYPQSDKVQPARQRMAALDKS
jgi:TolA-binding protein